MSEVFPKLLRKKNAFKERKAMQSRQKCKTMCFEKLSVLDVYGQSISLTYKGEDSFKSPIGTAISILVLVLLMAFGFYKFIILIYRINPDVS